VDERDQSGQANAAATRDPEARFSVADPGKEWRRGRGIPVVASFDGYRALGVLGVVFAHILLVAGVLGRLSDSLGDVAVLGVIPRLPLSALFIVSGFVIYLPTVARDGDFGRVSAFAVRRVARILPAYWVVLLVAIILLAAVPSPDGLPGVGSISTHIAFLQGPALLFDSSYKLGFGVVPPVWTLSVEMAFYVVLPFVAASYYRRPFVGLALAAALAVVWRLLAQNADSVVGVVGGDLSSAANLRIDTYYASQFPTWALSIAAGMTGAWCYVKIRDRWPAETVTRRAKQAAVAAALILVTFIYFGGHEVASNPVTFNAEFARQSIAVTLGVPLSLAALFVALCLIPQRLQRPISSAPLRWTADISYGIYLIHFAVIWFALRQLNLPHTGTLWAVLVWCAVVYPVSFAYAYLSARFLERPVRRWAHQFGRRAEAVKGARAPA
jgi:peptidoglycan/LPS O-acetylase OafA/YrhL